MESQDGRHVGAEGRSSEVKPGQMDLIAAMLAGMRQEMAVDREAKAQRAREQAERTDQLAGEQAERTDQLAREQAQRADDQVRHLEDVVQSSLASLKAETQYTDQVCDSVRNELLDKVQTLEGEVQGLREEVRTEKQRRELATARAEEQAAPRVLAGIAGVADLLGSAWGPWQEPLARGPRSVMSEPVAASWGWGNIGTPPLSRADGSLGLSQRKPAEYDGKDFATVAAPLHRLTRKGACFVWDEACQAAFDGLKKALVEAPVLPYPDPKLPYLLDTDASAEGIGAVLSQVLTSAAEGDDKWHKAQPKSSMWLEAIVLMEKWVPNTTTQYDHT
ncbi:hypothetical protein O3P69_017875 [Scylla paramamosain]|uniref:Reverse transcriptase/retrotransposon-derived protein RNase H-like domain-containing protein n=1 Tax=Scylla paramamosain TaxID=85552 RepID=A0AAW0THE1_SCYPA